MDNDTRKVIDMQESQLKMSMHINDKTEALKSMVVQNHNQINFQRKCLIALNIVLVVYLFVQLIERIV